MDKKQKMVDQANIDSFPASDPPSWSPVKTGLGQGYRPPEFTRHDWQWIREHILKQPMRHLRAFFEANWGHSRD